ncbi:MAG: glycosyltransferase [Crocinitomicaceae bacterium]|nr:glycosyltransferase [Crocinitomicaceae bacterium]
MNLTVIIPTLNEELYIGRLLDKLLTTKIPKENIMVVDGGSTDQTFQIVYEKGVRILTEEPSRAIQMNRAAKEANTEWLYFVHADTVPPDSWPIDFDYLIENEFEAGTYRSKFENGPVMLNLNAFFTRFNLLIARGGDQSLFIKKAVFFELGAYNEKMTVMEEYPLIEALIKRRHFKLFKSKTRICTRKYKGRSWLKVSRANYVAFKMYKNGEDSALIKKRYLELLG